jgi:hypothetical protein
LYTKWVTRATRPISLSQDPDFKQYIKSISGGKYFPPSIPTVQKCIVELAAASMQLLKNDVQALSNEGILPSVAADIWGENGKSLFGLLLYYITPDFVFTEKVRCWHILCLYKCLFEIYWQLIFLTLCRVLCSWLLRNPSVW